MIRDRQNIIDIDIFLENRQRIPVKYVPINGQIYIEAIHGRKYTIEIKNLTAGKIEVPVTIDGLDILTGVAPQQTHEVLTGESTKGAHRGYLISPYQTLTVKGWRTSLEQSAAFVFGSRENAYATVMGKATDHLGEICVNIFLEKKAEPLYPYPHWMPQYPTYTLTGTNTHRGTFTNSVSSCSNTASYEAGSKLSRASKSIPSLGTEFGTSQIDRVREVSFQRSTAVPLSSTVFFYRATEEIEKLCQRHGDTSRFCQAPQPNYIDASLS